MTNVINEQNTGVQTDYLNSLRMHSEIDPTSVELQFAAMQNDLAKENRAYAKEKIDAIKVSQAKSKEITQVIVDLRNAVAGLKDGEKVSTEKINNLENVLQMCKDYGIEFPGDKALMSAVSNLRTAIDNAIGGPGGQIEVSKIPDINGIRSALRGSDVNFNTKHYPNYHNISTRDLFGVNNIGWKHVSTADAQELIDNIFKGMKCSVSAINATIQSFQNIQETIGSDTQQQMLLIQDFMSKVSSYSQGAISAINKSGDTTTAIVR